MRSIDTPRFIAIFTFLPSGFCAAALLTTDVGTDLSDGTTPGGGRVTRVGTAISGPLSDTMSRTVGDATGSTSLTVDYGYIKATADAAAAEFGTFPFSRIANGFATGSWEAEITVDSAGRTGEIFSTSFFVDIAGTLNTPPFGPPGGASALTDWAFSLTLGDGGTRIIDVGGRQQATMSGAPAYTGDTLGLYESDSVAIEFGTPFKLIFELVVSASATSAYSGSMAVAHLDFSNTATWMGFGDVVDDLGSMVTDYSASSDAGVDFSGPLTAIPLPAGAWFLLSAIGVLVTRRGLHSASS